MKASEKQNEVSMVEAVNVSAKINFIMLKDNPNQPGVFYLEVVSDCPDSADVVMLREYQIYDSLQIVRVEGEQILWENKKVEVCAKNQFNDLCFNVDVKNIIVVHSLTKQWFFFSVFVALPLILALGAVIYAIL